MNAPTPPVPAPAEVIQTGLTGASSNLAKVLKAGHFAVCVEVSPPVGPNLEAIQREIKTLRGYGDAYNVTDNQSAMVHVSSLAVSIMLKQAGMEPVVQFTCRDRNRLGIQGDILGASVFGINTMLFLSGDHPIWGDHPQCKPVYDIDSINLIRIARMMRNNRVFENNKQIPKLRPTSSSARSRIRLHRRMTTDPCAWQRKSSRARSSSRRSSSTTWIASASSCAVWWTWGYTKRLLSLQASGR